MDSDDKVLRDLDAGTSFQAIRATYNLRLRLTERSEAQDATEIFKLKFIKKCLESQFLEKRIQGIKDLNEFVRNATDNIDEDASRKMHQWMIENGVFDIIWDPKKTHI